MTNSAQSLSPGPNKTLYGVKGLETAKTLFGPNTRLAKCFNRYHPSNGLPFIELSKENELIIPEPPFFKHRPNSEFDEFYDGVWGWE